MNVPTLLSTDEITERHHRYQEKSDKPCRYGHMGCAVGPGGSCLDEELGKAETGGVMKIQHTFKPIGAPRWGPITRRRNPVWGGVALGPFGLFYWLRPDALRRTAPRFRDKLRRMVPILLALLAVGCATPHWAPREDVDACAEVAARVVDAPAHVREGQRRPAGLAQLVDAKLAESRLARTFERCLERRGLARVEAPSVEALR